MPLVYLLVVTTSVLHCWLDLAHLVHVQPAHLLRPQILAGVRACAISLFLCAHSGCAATIDEATICACRCSSVQHRVTMQAREAPGA